MQDFESMPMQKLQSIGIDTNWNFDEDVFHFCDNETLKCFRQIKHLKRCSLTHFVSMFSFFLKMFSSILQKLLFPLKS